MANNTNNVTFGKPNIAGCLYSAPVGTTLPTSANAVLNSAFKQLGYLSDAGVTNPQSTDDPTLIRAFGGDVVLSIPGEFTETYEFEMIETLNFDVNAEIYGDDNVETIADGYKVTKKNIVLPEKSYIFDFLLKNGKLRRVVVPKGTIIRNGDIEHTDEEALKYPAKVSCIANEDNEYVYEYTYNPPAPNENKKDK
jgi:hypothetical protein